MSITVPHKSGVLLEGIDTRIAATELGLVAGESGVLSTMTSLNGFGAQRAAVPNPHMGVLTTAGGNFANYITSIIVQQKQFTCDLVFAIGADWAAAIQKINKKWMSWTLPPEEGYTSGDGFKFQMEITDWTLKGDIGGRVMVSVQITPTSQYTKIDAVVTP